MPLKALGLALALLGGGGQNSVEPEEALRRSFERKPTFNVDAIIEQRGPSSGPMKVRMWRDTTGRRRTEIIYPMAMQGRIFLDDGVTWTMFFPDSKVLRVHPSPVPESDDLNGRMNLIRRNYRLEIDSKTTVAGRPSVRVVATPNRSDGLETQRFYLDAATYTPLKIETVDGLGNVVVQFAVRRIEFPAKLGKDIFELPSMEGVRKETGGAPMSIKGRDEIERKLGFRPASPDRLPMGFRKQGSDMLDWKRVNPLAIRLTDGLVRLVVFQFKPKDEPNRPPRPGDDKVSKDVGEIRVEVRGDGPIAVKERILAEYVRILEKRARTQQP